MMQLHVRVIEAVDIARMDLYKSDPYCIVSCTGQNSSQRTRAIQNTLKPRWNQDFHFNISNQSMSVLRIVMRDEDIALDDDMAQLQIQLCAIPFGQILDQWYDMTPMRHVKKGGKLHLCIQITPVGAPPFVPISPQAPMYPNQGYPYPAPMPQNPMYPPQQIYPQSQMPPGYGAPGYNAPGYNAPGYNAPGYNAPGYNAPGYNTPGYNAPGYNAPGYNTPGYNAPVYGAPGYGAPGYGAPGYGAPGYGQMPAYGASSMPPRPPGMCDKAFRKLCKAQKKMIKKILF